MKKPKRSKITPGHNASVAHANKHRIKVFRLLDAENNKLDQRELFDEPHNK